MNDEADIRAQREQQKALEGRIGRTPEGYDWMRKIESIGKRNIADDQESPDEES